VRPLIVHQTGAADRAEVAAGYAAAGIDAEVHDFIRDMASQYARADLVLSRAGAITLSELGAIGRAALLIPFPFAADDHQTGNARALAEAGAARLLPQPEATPDRLAELLAELLADPAGRARMAAAMRSLPAPVTTLSSQAQYCARNGLAGGRRGGMPTGVGARSEE